MNRQNTGLWRDIDSANHVRAICAELRPDRAYAVVELMARTGDDGEVVIPARWAIEERENGQLLGYL